MSKLKQFIKAFFPDKAKTKALAPEKVKPSSFLIHKEAKTLIELDPAFWGVCPDCGNPYTLEKKYKLPSDKRALITIKAIASDFVYCPSCKHTGILIIEPHFIKVLWARQGNVILLDEREQNKKE